ITRIDDFASSWDKSFQGRLKTLDKETLHHVQPVCFADFIRGRCHGRRRGSPASVCKGSSDRPRPGNCRLGFVQPSRTRLYPIGTSWRGSRLDASRRGRSLRNRLRSVLLKAGYPLKNTPIPCLIVAAQTRGFKILASNKAIEPWTFTSIKPRKSWRSSACPFRAAGWLTVPSRPLTGHARSVAIVGP